MKLVKMIFLSVLLLSACSSSNNSPSNQKTLNQNINGKANLDDFVKDVYNDMELSIYEKVDSNPYIRTLLYRNNKLVNHAVLDLRAVTEKEIHWTYMGNEEEDIYFLIGAVKKEDAHLLTFNDRPYTGNIITIGETNVFFSFFDSAVPLPIIVGLVSEEK